MLLCISLFEPRIVNTGDPTAYNEYEVSFQALIIIVLQNDRQLEINQKCSFQEQVRQRRLDYS